jgi:lipoprotein NlpD
MALVAGCGGGAVKQEPAPPGAQVEQQSVTYFLYSMRSGETLYSLGERFGVPWQEIAEANHVEDPGQIPIGTQLMIRQVPGMPLPARVAQEPPQTRSASVQPADLSRGKPSSPFWWPTEGRIVRHYGDRVRGFPEPGIAIVAAADTEVCAVADGSVVSVTGAGAVPEPAWGNSVALAHSGGMASWYGHLDQIAVAKGQAVRRGEPIGMVGATGAADGPQLAFRMYRNERPVDPERYLP